MSFKPTRKNILFWGLGAVIVVLLALWLKSNLDYLSALIPAAQGGNGLLVIALIIGVLMVGLLTYRNWKGNLQGTLLKKYNSPKSRFLTFMLLVVLIPSLFIYSQTSGNTGANAAIHVIQYLFAVVTVAFIWLFTQPLPVVENRLPGSPEPEEAPGDEPGAAKETAQHKFARLKIYWMFFSYSFMVLALIAAVYPFMTDLKPEPSQNTYEVSFHRTMDSPIGVFRGCTSDAQAANTPVSCGQETNPAPAANGTTEKARVAVPQLSWILQVGGYVEPIIPDGLEAYGAILKNTSPTPLSNLPPPADPADGTVRTADQTDSMKEYLELAQAKVQRGDAGYQVTGGLVIPFYLVVLSLVGGAISLTRRIPEYQRQAAPGYVGDPNHPALTPAMLRDLLVFQIIQFLTAPFLASIAYLVIGPSGTAGTVGLAFAAGFASETVLLWVRAATDKLMPDTAKQQVEATGTIAGTLELNGKFPDTAKALEQAVTITIVSRTDVIAQFFDRGRFALSAVPTGPQVLQVKCKSGDANALEVVNIQSNNTHMVQLQLICGSADTGAKPRGPGRDPTPAGDAGQDGAPADDDGQDGAETNRNGPPEV